MVLHPFVHSHELPQGKFSFFSDWIFWVEYSFTHFKQEIGKFFIFLHYFSIVFIHFSKKWFLGPFSTPMDQPTFPVAWICTPTSPEPNQPKDDIANQNILWFLDFFGEVVFFAIFVHFGPQRPPSKGRTKKMGALGSLLRVPSPPPDPILSTKSQHYILFLLGAYSCTCHFHPAMVSCNFAFKIKNGCLKRF